MLFLDVSNLLENVVALRRFTRGLALLLGVAVGLAFASANAFAEAVPDKAEAEKAAVHATTGKTADSVHDEHHLKGVHPEGKADPAAWRSDLALWSFVVFLLLLAILTKFAWGPISAALDKREQSIADNIASAQRAADDAKAIIAQYEAKLAGAAEQVQAMIDEARRDAESTKQQILTEAKVASQAEQDRALREIRTAADSAVRELAVKGADLATELAGKMLRAQMSKADHARLVQETVANFVAASPSAN